MGKRQEIRKEAHDTKKKSFMTQVGRVHVHTREMKRNDEILRRQKGMREGAIER